MKLYNLLAVILLSLYIPLISQEVDPAINPHIMKIEQKAIELDHIIQTGYKNETAPLRAVELDLKIQESNQHQYTNSELRKMSYDTLIYVDEKFVYKKIKLAGKKNVKKELEKLSRAIARKYGISPNLFAAIIKAESDFELKALSHMGAHGLCQILPENFKRLGIKKPFDPIQNMSGGAKLFKQLMTQYKGNINYALAAYNAGSGAVDVYNGVPPYKETQEYVKRVLEIFRGYKKG